MKREEAIYEYDGCNKWEAHLDVAEYILRTHNDI